MSRRVTWFDRSDEPPDVAPLAAEGERVILRVPIGPTEKAPRVRIPLVPPPPEARRKEEPKAEQEPAQAPVKDEVKKDKGERRADWPPTREVLERLVREGRTNREIAEMFGVAKVTVEKTLQKYGIRRDPELRAALRSRGGRAGREAGWDRNDFVFGDKARKEAAATTDGKDEERPADEDRAAGDGRTGPIDEAVLAAIATFGEKLARAIAEAWATGLEVDVRLRVRVVDRERAEE